MGDTCGLSSSNRADSNINSLGRGVACVLLKITNSVVNLLSVDGKTATPINTPVEYPSSKNLFISNPSVYVTWETVALIAFNMSNLGNHTGFITDGIFSPPQNSSVSFSKLYTPAFWSVSPFSHAIYAIYLLSADHDGLSFQEYWCLRTLYLSVEASQIIINRPPSIFAE